MRTRKSVLVSAAATAISTLALAQAGGGAAGAGGATGAAANEQPAAIYVGPGGTVTRSQDISPGGARREVPLQGGSTVGNSVDSGPVAQVGGPPVDVRPPQQRLTGTQTPTTQPMQSGVGPIGVNPAPAAGGTATGRVDTSPGTGGVTSSTAGTTGTTFGGAPVQPAAGGGAPVIAAPSGFLQGNQQPNVTGGPALQGGFGSDPNATADTTTPGVPSTEIDVTRRTQELSQQPIAQPAGSTLPPAQPATQPTQERGGPRPSIPMPAPSSPSGNLAPAPAPPAAR